MDCDYSRMLRLCLPVVSLSADYQTADQWRRASEGGGGKLLLSTSMKRWAQSQALDKLYT